MGIHVLSSPDFQNFVLNLRNVNQNPYVNFYDVGDRHSHEFHYHRDGWFWLPDRCATINFCLQTTKTLTSTSETTSYTTSTTSRTVGRPGMMRASPEAEEVARGDGGLSTRLISFPPVLNHQPNVIDYCKTPVSILQWRLTNRLYFIYGEFFRFNSPVAQTHLTLSSPRPQISNPTRKTAMSGSVANSPAPHSRLAMVAS